MLGIAVVAGWLPLTSSAQSGPVTIQWEFAGILKLMDNEGNPLASPHNVPFAQRADTTLRIGFFIRVTETGGRLRDDSRWDHLPGLGIDNTYGVIRFGVMGIESTTISEILENDVVDRLAPPPAGSRSDDFVNEESGHDPNYIDAWNFDFDRGHPLLGDPNYQSDYMGAWCDPGTGNSCEIPLGYLELRLRNLQAGWSLRARAESVDGTEISAAHLVSPDPLNTNGFSRRTLGPEVVINIGEALEGSPNLNGDNSVDASDALIMYYAYALRNDLGTGR